MNAAGKLFLSLLWAWLWLAPGVVLAHAPAAPSTGPLVVETGQALNLGMLLDRVRDKRLVLVGETHTNVADHQLQLQVLQGMQAQGRPLALGVEWFQRRFQPVLDDYIAGRIDEPAMLRGTEYFKRWGFDYRLYRDIMRYAREQGIRVVALNAERELTDAVRMHGLDGMDPELRGQLPAEYDFDDAGYAERLRQVFSMHRKEMVDDVDLFQRFLEVQLTWDETMAETASDYLSANPQHRMLLLAGRGHTHSGAIPPRIQRRTAVQGVSVGGFEPDAPFNQPDYLVLQPGSLLPESGLIGVALQDRDGAVVITGFSRHGKAEQAGVMKDDRLLAIDDAAIADYTDVKLQLMNTHPGQVVNLSLQREGLFGLETTVEVEVTLTGRSGVH